MKNKRKSILPVVVLILLAVFYFFNGSADPTAIGIIGGADGPTEIALIDKDTAPAKTAEENTAPAKTVDEDGVYDSKEEVAEYIHLYGHLPSNFITKKEAQAAGWTGGELDDDCPGKCIGGDYFGNREGLLPKAKGRSYTECDINTLGAKSRGKERIVFSNDGLIYYTNDHYESFTLLYGTP